MGREALRTAQQGYCRHKRVRASIVRMLRLLLACPATLCLAACTAAPPFDARAVAREWADYMQRDYCLRPGDKIAVRIEETANAASETSDQELVVSPAGTVTIRYLPEPLTVGGRSIQAIRDEVLEACRKQFASPRVSLSLREAAAQSVYVCGEVGHGGPIAYQAGMTMTQAVASAGGFLYTVKENDVRVLRIAPDGTQRTFRVDMESVLRDQQPDFLLLPGDLVYCQTSTIADIGNLVELYVRRLLPFSLSGPSIGQVGK